MITINSILDVEKYIDDVGAVVFDLDDTLYPEIDYVKSGFRAVASAFPQVSKLFEKLWDAFSQNKPAISFVFENESMSDYAEKALRVYRNHYPDIELYPGVGEMISRIRKEKMVGIITDGRPEGQRAKISALGISAEEIIITDELGGVEFRKPNPLAFEKMQKALGVPFREMAYIGDNPEKDFTAPEKLGMKSVFFCNPNGLHSCKQ